MDFDFSGWFAVVDRPQWLAILCFVAFLALMWAYGKRSRHDVEEGRDDAGNPSRLTSAVKSDRSKAA